MNIISGLTERPRGPGETVKRHSIVFHFPKSVQFVNFQDICHFRVLWIFIQPIHPVCVSELKKINIVLKAFRNRILTVIRTTTCTRFKTVRVESIPCLSKLSNTTRSWYAYHSVGNDGKLILITKNLLHAINSLSIKMSITYNIV